MFPRRKAPTASPQRGLLARAHVTPIALVQIFPLRLSGLMLLQTHARNYTVSAGFLGVPFFLNPFLRRIASGRVVVRGGRLTTCTEPHLGSKQLLIRAWQPSVVHTLQRHRLALRPSASFSIATLRASSCLATLRFRSHLGARLAPRPQSVAPTASLARYPRGGSSIHRPLISSGVPSPNAIIIARSALRRLNPILRGPNLHSLKHWEKLGAGHVGLLQRDVTSPIPAKKKGEKISQNAHNDMGIAPCVKSGGPAQNFKLVESLNTKP